MRKRLDQALTYGTQGGPTHHALEDLIALVEGGTRSQIFGTGLAACVVPLLGYLSAGDDLLMPDSVYGPVRSFCDSMLRRLGVTTRYYRTDTTADALAPLIQPQTRVLYLESPGSHTFEMQDVPALSALAHAHNLTVMIDNTWGFANFDPFAHGVDVSMQALTKYASGHSDILLGAATTASDHHWQRVRDAALILGQYASPDDCWLAIRGMRTLSVRLDRQMESGLTVARWFATRPEVAQVLHPALPGSPGHDIWARDFTGACSLFGVVFAPPITAEATHRMVDALKLFGIGASWGGYESLALPTTGFVTRSDVSPAFSGPMVRFHVGLEDPLDLIADLEQAFRQVAG